MPVTAKLSRAFYERLGDEIADGLVDWMNDLDATYRTELRQLNEANVARFEAKLDARAAEITAAFRDVIADLRSNDLASIRIELRDREVRLVRWMLAFWVTAFGMMIALQRLWG